MPTVLISGALANKPFNGGNAWSRLSWILGFKALGLDVFFVEQITTADCVDDEGRPTSFQNSANRQYFSAVMKRFGLEESSALVCDGGREIAGPPREALVAKAEAAEALFNLSGHLTLAELCDSPACRIYYDDDPGFTQFWHDDGNSGARLHGHDYYYTIGANIGDSNCEIPTGGINWRHTRPPVGLEDWPAALPGEDSSSGFSHNRLAGGAGLSTDSDCTMSAGALDGRRFTTVASWRGAYAPVSTGGRTFGVKAHEFRKIINLPVRLGSDNGGRFEIALQIHPGDRRDLEALCAHGWVITDPAAAAGSPDEFRRYVQGSGAEFSVAQGIYVETNSGWFSDRTVRYLASGKPALVQETGFSRHIPVGHGLLTFRTLEEAVDAAGRIMGDYEHHCRAARRLAEEHFDSKKVIRQLAAEIGLTVPRG